MAILSCENKVYLLQTRNTSYVIRIHEGQFVENVYWGSRMERPEDFLEEGSRPVGNVTEPQCIREECSFFGGMRFKEASMKLSFGDGVRDYRPGSVEVRTEGEHLEIVLQDSHYPVAVHLHYQVYGQEDIIARWRVVENLGQETVYLEKVFSAEYGLPGTGYEVLNYNGRWAAEFQAARERLACGKKVYESGYGLTAHGNQPVFAVCQDAGEDHGEVWYGVLAYSGNFKVLLQPVESGFLNIMLGISDTDFTYCLKAGERFVTPRAYAGYTDRGLEGMTHRLQDLARNQISPGYWRDRVLPVLYNSWYSTLFGVTCEDQMALAGEAARLGVELFVVDDGWFTGRRDDRAGLGDWTVDPCKFPEGLGRLIDRVRELGMRFGLWIEPEMVNPDSALYRAHPDWIYRYGTREVLMGRNQYMLNMASGEVLEYLEDCFDRLLSEYDITYIKWDMNRYASEMGSPLLPPSEWKSLWYRNTLGVYRLAEALRRKHPEVEFEACASGGGRVDFGAMGYFDEFWPSDNTDALDRLMIQEGYSYFYPARYMRAWVTDDSGMDGRKIPLAFSMHAAMCGSLGIGIDLNTAEAGRMEEVASYIARYKQVRETVQTGRLYRLCSLQKGELQAVQYAGDGESVLFVFLVHARYGRTEYEVRLRGLDPDSLYTYESGDSQKERSGQFLMKRGIRIQLRGDYDSRMIVFRQEKNS